MRVGEDFVLDVFTLMRSRSLDANFDYAALAADAESFLLSSGGRVAFPSAARLIDLERDSGRSKDEAGIAVLRELLAYRGQRIPVDLDQLGPTSDPAGASGSEQGQWPPGPIS